VRNLHALCPRHHHLKHDVGWRVHRDADGITRWQSPAGATYTCAPDELPLDRTVELLSGTDPPRSHI
jgi:hypothetical protein